MKIKVMRLSVIFKMTLFLLAALGILIQIGVFSGELRLSDLNYYTLLSNVLCAVYFFAATLYEWNRKRTFLPQFKGAVVLGITITGLVYHFLQSGSFQTQDMTLSNLLLHYVVPLMSVMDWLLFSDKGHYRWTSPFVWSCQIYTSSMPLSA